MALSEPSDQIAINDRGKGATWQREERLITRGFLAIDLHLSIEEYVAKSGFTGCVLISTVDREEL